MWQYLKYKTKPYLPEISEMSPAKNIDPDRMGLDAKKWTLLHANNKGAYKFVHLLYANLSIQNSKTFLKRPLKNRQNKGLKDKLYLTGVIKFRINQDFLFEHSCILHIRSNLLLL